jgi:hypothetical protein
MAFVLGDKKSRAKYINERCELVVGKTAEEAIGMMVPNSRGNQSQYLKADLQYDVNAGRLVQNGSHPKADSSKPKAPCPKPKVWCSEAAESPRTTHWLKKGETGCQSAEVSEDGDFEEQLAGIDPSEQIVQLVGRGSNGRGWHGPVPTRDSSGCVIFEDAADFRPNLTPKEVLQLGSFGGGYFRPIFSKVTVKAYDRVWEELPEDWIEGMDVETQVASTVYRIELNKYKVNCGGKVNKADAFGQHLWEQSGWIEAQDPYGWFMWYCRFYQGRRSDDDSRQIGRWAKCAGLKGRWKQNLIGKCLSKGLRYDDGSVSPVVRQTLQHWAYRLTETDFEVGSKRVRTHGASYMPKAQLKHVMVAGEEKEAGARAGDGRKAKRAKATNQRT